VPRWSATAKRFRIRSGSLCMPAKWSRPHSVTSSARLLFERKRASPGNNVSLLKREACGGHTLRAFSLGFQAGSSGAKQSASTGQTRTQMAQWTQSPGRGSQGKPSLISMQSVGHTGTQSPQPVQRVSSSAGRSCMAISTLYFDLDGVVVLRPPNRLQQPAHDLNQIVA
jgi:hypothetical protein